MHMSAAAAALPKPRPSDAPVLKAQADIPAVNKMETKMKTRWNAFNDMVLVSA